MVTPYPELEDWDKINDKADGDPMNLSAGAFTRSLQKVTTGIVNMTLQVGGLKRSADSLNHTVNSLTGDVQHIVKNLKDLNKNLERFNDQTTSLTRIGLWLTLIIALATVTGIFF